MSAAADCQSQKDIIMARGTRKSRQRIKSAPLADVTTKTLNASMNTSVSNVSFSKPSAKRNVSKKYAAARKANPPSSDSDNVDADVDLPHQNVRKTSSFYPVSSLATEQDHASARAQRPGLLVDKAALFVLGKHYVLCCQ